MSDKFYIGLDLTGFENNGVQRPISRVTLQMDGENILTSGDDTGLELSADCPHATQAMVNSLLAQLKGSTYKMYSASDANLDPAAELGDGITACGIYSVISRIADDGMGFPSPSAPGKEELEDEYPAGGPMTQAIERKISETRSSITKTANEIRLEVERINNNVTDLSTSISVELGKITNSIQDINGNCSKLEQTVNGLSLSVSNGSTSSTISLKAGETVISSQNIIMNGLVTFKGLESGETAINGACIKTGTIDADRLNLTGKITFSDLNSSAQSLINSANTNASNALTAANTASNTVKGWAYSGTTYIDGSKIMANTVTASKLQGGIVNLLGESGNIAGQIGLIGDYNDTTGRMYIQSYLVRVGSMFNPTGVVYFGDFENKNEAGHIFPGSDSLEIVGRNSRKIKLCYEGNEGEGGTFKTLLTAGFDTLTFNYNGSNTVHCYNNLDLHNYSVLNSSDQRLKTNIQPADVNALEIINAMRTYSFDWIENGRHETLGFIAQQLEKVQADFVDISKSDGHYSTKELKMIPYLIKAVQELSMQLDCLQHENRMDKMPEV